jgi:hypothetical protein
LQGWPRRRYHRALSLRPTRRRLLLPRRSLANRHRHNLFTTLNIGSCPEAMPRSGRVIIYR